jgi:DeoR/GlpR family transcriptional regulator of sugar metabolism
LSHPSHILLAFDLVCDDDTTLITIGDAVRMIARFTPEQREMYWWRNAIDMLNVAIREPSYIVAATVTLRTALTLSGMLAPETL